VVDSIYRNYGSRSIAGRGDLSTLSSTGRRRLDAAARGLNRRLNAESSRRSGLVSG